MPSKRASSVLIPPALADATQMPCPELGPGWIRLSKERPKGPDKQGKHVDHYYLSPDGKRYRSMVEAQRSMGICVGAGTSVDAIVCMQCRSGDDAPWNQIMLCDGQGCGGAYHMDCLPYDLGEVPEGDWLCPDCERDGPPGVGLAAEAAAAAAAEVAAKAAKAAADEYAAAMAAHYEAVQAAPTTEVPLEDLHPSCTVRGCIGAGRLFGDDQPFRLECEACGAQWQSSWWARLLKARAEKGAEEDTAVSTKVTPRKRKKARERQKQAMEQKCETGSLAAAESAS